MPKYHKKPVVIEAIQWNRKNTDAIKEFGAPFYMERHPDTPLYIETLEGVMRAEPYDYIIRGVKGEFYPCKPDIFEATYELAEE